MKSAHRGQNQLTHLRIKSLCARTLPGTTLKLIDQSFDLKGQGDGHIGVASS